MCSIVLCTQVHEAHSVWRAIIFGHARKYKLLFGLRTERVRALLIFDFDELGL